MVLTDQYMQKMETELTEVRQCVVKMEAAMQKFLNNSREAEKASSQKKDGNAKNDSKDSKDSKSVGDQLVASLKKARDQGNKIGEDIGKAAGNALSKAGDALINYLKTGKLDLSSVVTSLKTDAKNIATKEATSLLAGGLLKWLGVNDDKTKAKPGEKQDAKSVAGSLQSGFKNFFDQFGKDFGKFLDDGKDFIGTVSSFFKGKNSDGTDSDNPVRKFLGGLTKDFGKFLDDGKDFIGTVSSFFKGKNSDGTDSDNPVSKFLGGLTKSIGQFFKDGKTVLGQLFNFVTGKGQTGGVPGNEGKSGGILGFFGNLGQKLGSLLGIKGHSGNGTAQVVSTGNAMGQNTAEGMQQVADQGKKSADEMANAMQGAMKRTESVLTKFVETGKMSFKDLARSILADIAQIMIKMAVSKLIGSIFGGASASAAGGFDVPAGDNPVTRLHEKEMVLPAQYANVIRGLAANGGTAGGSGININTSISVASDGSSDQQSDGSGSSQRQLADMINSQTKAIIAREMRQGGLIWNMRMGVA